MLSKKVRTNYKKWLQEVPIYCSKWETKIVSHQTWFNNGISAGYISKFKG